MNLDDDAFWETATTDTGVTLADVPDTLVEYGQVLRTCFPAVTPFVGLALGSKPRACTILGSHLIEVTDTGDAKWWQTVGSRPIPPNYNFASPPLGQKIPASTCFMHRQCKSPKDFRLWLQAVVADIRKTALDMVLEALCTDNFMAQPAITLQQAHNLHLTGVTEITQAPATLNAWVEARDRSNTYSIPLLRKGQVMGQIVLGWKDDAWRYGVVVGTTLFGGELKIKHQAPATVQLRHLDVAKAAAVKLYHKSMFDFLVQMALNNPTLRGA